MTEQELYDVFMKITSLLSLLVFTFTSGFMWGMITCDKRDKETTDD